LSGTVLLKKVEANFKKEADNLLRAVFLFKKRGGAFV
jgi:hypothetical protein